MRKTIGIFYYLLGGAALVLLSQLLIRCEGMGAFSKFENQSYDFWSFVVVTDGHHLAYPNGYAIHLLRDFVVAIWAVLVIQAGRKHFASRKRARTEKIKLITCPGCRRSTYAEAFCRYCGFNLVTNNPVERGFSLALWKVSVLAYAGISVVLLIINLLLSN